MLFLCYHLFQLEAISNSWHGCLPKYFQYPKSTSCILPHDRHLLLSFWHCLWPEILNWIKHKHIRMLQYASLLCLQGFVATPNNHIHNHRFPGPTTQINIKQLMPTHMLSLLLIKVLFHQLSPVLATHISCYFFPLSYWACFVRLLSTK
jgi:hypothetical protein